MFWQPGSVHAPWGWSKTETCRSDNYVYFHANLNYSKFNKKCICWWVNTVYWCSRKSPVILATSYWNFNFLDGFSKNTQIWNFMKIHPVRAKLYHADGRTHRHEEANSHFSQFCERTRIKTGKRVFDPHVTIYFNNVSIVCHVHSLRLGVFYWRRLTRGF